jgi:hypothetical protein
VILAEARPAMHPLQVGSIHLPSSGHCHTQDSFFEGTGPTNSESSLASLPRGPPRKPRQSGHALWVGNLPPGTTVTDLKDHFSRDATKDIESLFLISKSNCAFVNYRTEESCTAAMHRFHDSRFHGVRLVCRLRRSSTPQSGVPTGPSAMSAPRPSSTTSSKPNTPSPGEDELAQSDDDKESESEPPGTPIQMDSTAPETGRVSEKFFVVKSLTVQDLELSVRNGIWATQSHNEEALNKAYEVSCQVQYLIMRAKLTLHRPLRRFFLFFLPTNRASTLDMLV